MLWRRTLSVLSSFNLPGDWSRVNFGRGVDDGVDPVPVSQCMEGKWCIEREVYFSIQAVIHSFHHVKLQISTTKCQPHFPTEKGLKHSGAFYDFWVLTNFVARSSDLPLYRGFQEGVQRSFSSSLWADGSFRTFRKDGWRTLCLSSPDKIRRKTSIPL